VQESLEGEEKAVDWVIMKKMEEKETFFTKFQVHTEATVVLRAETKRGNVRHINEIRERLQAGGIYPQASNRAGQGGGSKKARQ